MATVKQHLKKATYNENFFDDIKETYPDWAITGLFYSALHLIDAVLINMGCSAEDHKMRFQYVKFIKELKPLYADYRALYDCSINARYKMTSDLNIESLNDYHKKFFSPIKTTVTKLLN